VQSNRKDCPATKQTSSAARKLEAGFRRFEKIRVGIALPRGANSQSLTHNSIASFQSDGALDFLTVERVSREFSPYATKYDTTRCVSHMYPFLSAFLTPRHTHLVRRVEQGVGNLRRYEPLYHVLMIVVDSQLQRGSSNLRRAAAIRQTTPLFMQVREPPPAPAPPNVLHLYRCKTESKATKRDPQ
jgi:hypothetical protein